MKNTIKLATLALAILSISGLYGCGGGGDSTTYSAGATPSSPTGGSSSSTGPQAYKVYSGSIHLVNPDNPSENITLTNDQVSKFQPLLSYQASRSDQGQLVYQAKSPTQFAVITLPPNSRTDMPGSLKWFKNVVGEPAQLIELGINDACDIYPLYNAPNGDTILDITRANSQGSCDGGSQPHSIIEVSNNGQKTDLTNAFQDLALLAQADQLNDEITYNSLNENKFYAWSSRTIFSCSAQTYSCSPIYDGGNTNNSTQAKSPLKLAYNNADHLVLCNGTALNVSGGTVTDLGQSCNIDTRFEIAKGADSVYMIERDEQNPGHIKLEKRNPNDFSIVSSITLKDEFYTNGTIKVSQNKVFLVADQSSGATDFLTFDKDLSRGTLPMTPDSNNISEPTVIGTTNDDTLIFKASNQLSSGAQLCKWSQPYDVSSLTCQSVLSGRGYILKSQIAIPDFSGIQKGEVYASRSETGATDVHYLSLENGSSTDIGTINENIMTLFGYSLDDNLMAGAVIMDSQSPQGAQMDIFEINPFTQSIYRITNTSESNETPVM